MEEVDINVFDGSLRRGQEAVKRAEFLSLRGKRGME